MWFKDTEPLLIDGDVLKIRVKDDVTMRHLKDQYLKDIEEIIENTTGKKYTCEFVTETKAFTAEKNSNDNPFSGISVTPRSENDRISPLNPTIFLKTL